MNSWLTVCFLHIYTDIFMRGDIMCAACVYESQTYQTPLGTIYIEGPVKGPDIEQLTMNEELKNFRSPAKQKKALMEIADSTDGMVYIARLEKMIIGYVSFHAPDSYSRWRRHPRVIELGAIEVSATYRKFKIGKELMKIAFASPVMEDNILITLEYSWHWDVESSGLDLWNYQKMLTRLFGSVGMERVTTNDPDILEHPANVLMARIGKNVSEDDCKEFESLRFTNEGIFSKK